MQFLETINLDKAKNFLDVLSPRGKIFGQYSRANWIYRGVAAEKEVYPLLPSALRDGKHRSEFEKKFFGECKTTYEQIQAEAKVIRHFFNEADAAGLPLPEDSQSLRKTLHAEKFKDGELNSGVVWPPCALLSLVGLARHYGLPTRMLDWTRNPFIAAYFAARKPAELLFKDKKPRGEYISVWALLNREYKQAARQAAEKNALPNQECERGWPVKLVTAPRAGNPNLHAQEGLFSVQCIEINDETQPKSEINRKPLDELLQDTIGATTAGNAERQVDQPVIYYFKLPVNGCHALLRLLAKEGITAAKLFPNFQGAADAVQERIFRKHP